jgi:2-C-methyl-D-erythritol 2,4-cyclodiphosphate synthase
VAKPVRIVASRFWVEKRNRRGVVVRVRVGIGHDTHRLVAGRPLILGGVRIEHPLGLDGHSDADVVFHAVADALLGAAALGDIGEHFPDTDPEWRGLDGGRLLAEVVGLVENAGWRPVNCDVIIHAQAPKLTPYKATIKANVARRLGVDPSAVNVKAKTGERVGPVGRCEAIQCEAVVLLERTSQESDHDHHAAPRL